MLAQEQLIKHNEEPVEHSVTKKNDSSPGAKFKLMEYCDLRENSNSCHEKNQRATRKLRKAVQGEY